MTSGGIGALIIADLDPGQMCKFKTVWRGDAGQRQKPVSHAGGDIRRYIEVARIADNRIKNIYAVGVNLVPLCNQIMYRGNLLGIAKISGHCQADVCKCVKGN